MLAACTETMPEHTASQKAPFSMSLGAIWFIPRGHAVQTHLSLNSKVIKLNWLACQLLTLPTVLQKWAEVGEFGPIRRCDKLFGYVSCPTR